MMDWKAGAIAFVVSFASVSSANAGLFEFLFGGRAAPAPVTVQPVADHPAVTIAKSRAHRAAKRAPQPAPTIDPKTTLARTIDPVANPDWYLFDPTLRRGDVLVLVDRVLVFKGGRTGAQTSYVSLEQTRLFGAKERLMIAAMTRRTREPQLLAGGTGPRQPRLLKSASLVTPPEPRPGL